MSVAILILTFNKFMLQILLTFSFNFFFLVKISRAGENWTTDKNCRLLVKL